LTRALQLLSTRCAFLVARHDSERRTRRTTGAGMHSAAIACAALVLFSRRRGFDRGCNLAESESDDLESFHVLLVPLQPYPGLAVLSYVVLPSRLHPTSAIPSLRSCYPSPCDMGLSAMDNDGASPSIIVALRLLVGMIQCHGCSLAATLPRSYLLFVGTLYNQPSQCRQRASSTLHCGCV
jgi:hypothetical protein